MQWTIQLLAPGRFRVEIATAWHGKMIWHADRQLAVQVGHQSTQGKLRKNRQDHSPRTQYQKEAISVMGTLELTHAGPHDVTLKLLALAPDDPGVELSHIRLVRLD